MQESPERRRDPRITIPGRSLVRIRSMENPLEFFHLIDISRGGLAFRYLGDSELSVPVLELDILCSGDETASLKSLPVQAVCDSPLQNGFIPMRRRSLKFAPLTPEKKAEVEAFFGAWEAKSLQ